MAKEQNLINPTTILHYLISIITKKMREQYHGWIIINKAKRRSRIYQMMRTYLRNDSKL